MRTFQGDSADAAWRQVHRAITDGAAGKIQSSRVGETLELTHVALEIADPRQRWVVARRPAMNPAFGIAEVIWILAGSNASHVLNYWNRELPRFAGYEDTYHGAYGHRLRKHFGIDQIKRACDALKANPESRQVVLQLWDVQSDMPLPDGSPRNTDIPCNVASMLKVRDGRLEWTQIMRSNDVYRGLPYNLLQFTTLQEVMAGWLGLQLGSYHHWSDSLHAYMSAPVARDDSVVLVPNTDALSTSFELGLNLFESLYERLVEMTKDSVSESALSQMATMRDAPRSYQNMLRVLGAESARRRGRPDQSDELMADCDNGQLRQTWFAWLKRCSARSRQVLLANN